MSESGFLPSDDKHHKKDNEIQYWVFAVRIVLSLCLIFYHNHRLSDSYRHNLSIEISDDNETLRSLIKASQRTVLQAGLNLFMGVAGVSAFLSLRKRRVNLLQIMGERSFKLLAGFLFGMLVVAIPSNLFIQGCGTDRSWSEILSDGSLFNPGHLAFLPYLFILTHVLVPIKVTAMNGFSKRAEFVGMSPGASPAWFRRTALLWVIGFVLCNGRGMFFGLVFVIALCCLLYGHPAVINFYSTMVDNIYSQLKQSNNGAFVSTFSFLFPLCLLGLSQHTCAHYEFSNLGLTLILIVPLLCCFVPSWSFRPFDRFWPELSVNAGVVGMISVMAGQLICISYPVYLPLFPPTPSVSGSFVVEDLTNGGLIQRDFHAIMVMCVAHASYYLFGFYLMCYERNLPSLPFNNSLFVICLSLYYIIFPALGFSPSRDFFYITPGYTTFHYRGRRFWFHLGGWMWVCTVFMGCKNLVVSHFDGNSKSEKFVRFLRDNTFGTFLIHPLFGYMMCCLVRDMSIGVFWKIAMIDIGVYVLSYAWSHYMQKIRFVRNLFGTK